MTPQLLLPPSTNLIANYNAYRIMYDIACRKLEALLVQELKNPNHGGIHR